MIKLLNIMADIIDVILPTGGFYVFSIFNRSSPPPTLMSLLVDLDILFALGSFLHGEKILLLSTQRHISDIFFFAHHSVDQFSWFLSMFFPSLAQFMHLVPRPLHAYKLEPVIYWVNFFCSAMYFLFIYF